MDMTTDPKSRLLLLPKRSITSISNTVQQQRNVDSMPPASKDSRLPKPNARKMVGK